MTAAELINHRMPLGTPIAKSSALAGGKTALFDGEALFLSPAMHSLLYSETDAELEHLLSHIPVVVILRPKLEEIPISYVNFQ